LRSGPAYPRLVGYCNAARVLAVGNEIAGIAAGDRILTHQSHRTCFACDADDVLALIPAALDSRSASAAYIAHIGLNALQRAALQPGETVVIQGLGPIGLATVALARTMGAAHVVAIGNSANRIEKARALGATITIEVEDAELSARFLEAAGGSGAHVVINTVNSWSAWRTSLDLVLPFGRVAVLGFPGRGETLPDFNPLQSDPFYTKQPSILSVGLAAGPGNWGEGDVAEHRHTNMEFLLRLMTTGSLPLGDLITHERRWDELEAVYELAAAGDKEMIVPVLRWEAAR